MKYGRIELAKFFGLAGFEDFVQVLENYLPSIIKSVARGKYYLQMITFFHIHLELQNGFSITFYRLSYPWGQMALSLA